MLRTPTLSAPTLLFRFPTVCGDTAVSSIREHRPIQSSDKTPVYTEGAAVSVHTAEHQRGNIKRYEMRSSTTAPTAQGFFFLNVRRIYWHVLHIYFYARLTKTRSESRTKNYAMYVRLDIQGMLPILHVYSYSYSYYTYVHTWYRAFHGPALVGPPINYFVYVIGRGPAHQFFRG